MWLPVPFFTPSFHFKKEKTLARILLCCALVRLKLITDFLFLFKKGHGILFILAKILCSELHSTCSGPRENNRSIQTEGNLSLTLLLSWSSL
jgi:hypothetical protein